MNSTSILACIATGAAGIVVGSVIGAVGHSSLASAARESEIAKHQAEVKKLSSELKGARQNGAVWLGRLMHVEEKHPEALADYREPVRMTIQE